MALRALLDYGVGHIFWILGGLGVGIGIQMDVWSLAVIGIFMILYGFWLVGA